MKWAADPLSFPPSDSPSCTRKEASHAKSGEETNSTRIPCVHTVWQLPPRELSGGSNTDGQRGRSVGVRGNLYSIRAALVIVLTMLADYPATTGLLFAVTTTNTVSTRSACNFGVAVAGQVSRSALSANAAKGEKLFAQSCASCHEAHSRNQLIGPGLMGYYTEHPAPSDATVRELITRGKGAMPGFRSFSSTELADLIAYLRTL
jgi:mono/diheme cytochrome c family protein